MSHTARIPRIVTCGTNDCHGVEWLLTGSITQLVLAIISKDSRVTMERWVFDINIVDQPSNSSEPYVELTYC